MPLKHTTKRHRHFFKLLIAVIIVTPFGQSASAEAIKCFDAFSPQIKTVDSQTEDIADLAAFNKAMTTGMLLSAEQADLFEIYRKTAFGDPNTIVGKTLRDVIKLIKSNPGLEKPHFQEYNIESARREYQTPESLVNYLKSITATVGQVKSNLFQIEANLGYWKKMLNYEDPQIPPGLTKEQQKIEKQKQSQRFLRYMERIVSKESRAFIADPKSDYKEKVIALYKTLNQIQLWMNKRGRNSLAVRQAMVDLVASAGFHNAATLELLKSKNGLEKIEGLSKMFDERDGLAIELGFAGHFHELMASLQISYPTLSGKKENVAALVSSLERDVLAWKYTVSPTETVRVRSLSIQEAAFRSCLGGSDCASRTYFSKALDPNYNYFTMTNQNHESSGHITVVLGTAKDPNTGEEIKTAFVDKVQNVANQMLPKMLEAVRLSLLEKGYLLGIPEDTGAENGISNMSTITDFIKTNVLPNHKRRLAEFAPHAHKYNFENRYSRAYERLSVRIIGETKFDTETKFSRGLSYEPKQAPADLSKEKLAKQIIQLRESSDVESRVKYVDSGALVLRFEKLKLIPSGTYYKDMVTIAKDASYPIPLRKKSFYQTCLIAEQLDFSILDTFSPQERQQIQGEMKQWKGSTDPRKIRFITIIEARIKDIRSASDVEWLRGLGIDLADMYTKAVENNKFELGLILATTTAVNINSQFGFGRRTPIMQAIDYGIESESRGLIEYLLTRPDIDLNLKDKDGKTALTYAVEKQRFDLVRILFPRTHFSPETQQEEFAKLYSLSAAKGCGQICAFFHKHLGSLTAEASKAAFIQAVNNDKFDLALSIAQTERVDVNVQSGYYKRTPLMQVIDHDSDSETENLVAYLLNHPEIDLNLKDNEGKTALAYAVVKQKLELVKILLARTHFDASNKTEELAKLYILASGKGCSQVCAYLRGHIGELTDETAAKAFDQAIENNQFEFAKSIAQENRIDINTQIGYYRRTPLMLALDNEITHDANGFIDYLLSRPDIDLTPKDKDGKTALDYAIAKQNTDAADRIRAKLVRN